MGKGKLKKAAPALVRIFIGIPLQQQLKEEIGSFEGVLKQIEGIKAVKPDHLHVTLKFIGNTPERKLDRIKEIIDKSCEGIKPFVIKPESVSAFPSPDKASVVWLNCGEGATAISAIFKILEKELRAMAYAGEKQEYIPHITVARSRKMADITKIQGEIKISGTSQADCVVLYKSDLNPDGPEYSELYRKDFAQ